jgi:hypothetical protein
MGLRRLSKTYLDLKHLTCLLKPLILAGVGGGVAIAIAVAAILSFSASSPATEFQAPDEGSSALDSEIIREPEADAPANDPSTDEVTSFETDDNPIIEPDDTPANNIPDSPSTSSSVAYQLYVEPTSQAFSIVVPRGWSADGKVTSVYGLQASFTAQDPQQTKQIFFQKPRPQSYWIPTWAQPEGSTSHLGAVAYYNFMNADQYVQDILVPEFRQTAQIDLQVVTRSSIAEYNGYSAGVYLLTFPRSGLEDGAMLAFISTTATAAPSGEIALWSASINGIVTPLSEMDEFFPIGLNSLNSLTANPNVVGEFIEGAGTSSSVMASNTDAFLDVLRSSPMSSDVIADSTKYILNMEQVMNPATGQTFTVPLGHRWYDPTDRSILGSNPGNNPSIIELQPVN